MNKKNTQYFPYTQLNQIGETLNYSKIKIIQLELNTNEISVS